MSKEKRILTEWGYLPFDSNLKAALKQKEEEDAAEGEKAFTKVESLANDLRVKMKTKQYNESQLLKAFNERIKPSIIRYIKYTNRPAMLKEADEYADDLWEQITAETISPIKENEEEYTDDVEAEPSGYKIYEDDEVEVFEEIKPKKPIKVTPSVFKKIPAPKPSPFVFQPPPMPTKEEEYEYQRERNALARIKVFEGHKNVKSVF